MGRLHAEVEQEETVKHLDPDGFGRVLQQQRGSALCDAMERLPERQREVIEMCFLRELTHREVAARMGVPLGTVKTRALLGKAKLRSELAEARAFV